MRNRIVIGVLVLLLALTSLGFAHPINTKPQLPNNTCGNCAG